MLPVWLCAPQSGLDNRPLGRCEKAIFSCLVAYCPNRQDGSTDFQKR